jgi:predicted transglutaminase-like cysteine proteinase
LKRPGEGNSTLDAAYDRACYLITTARILLDKATSSGLRHTRPDESLIAKKNNAVWGMFDSILKGLALRRQGRLVLALKAAGMAVSICAPLAAGGALAGPRTLPAPADSIQPLGQAGPTQAWIEFCHQFSHECSFDPSEAAVITLTPTVWNTLAEVNENVNRAILPVTDAEHWMVADRWDYPDDGPGDCEDIQLLKRKLLTQAGLPQRALRMTVVIDELGEGHAVLMVRTDRGDFILDNKRMAVLPWWKTGYRYVKREGSDGPDWVWLGNQAAPIVTANK